VILGGWGGDCDFERFGKFLAWFFPLQEHIPSIFCFGGGWVWLGRWMTLSRDERSMKGMLIPIFSCAIVL
jgi:hypothetical protein